MLADDEMMVRKVGRTLLEKAGLTVLEAEDGRQAMELYHQYRNDIDMLILDYAMPELNGAAIFNAVRQDNAAMPVLISSGYADLKEIDRLIQQGAAFVQKPFRVHELLSKVQKLLG